jgi:hypothetical protein
VKLTAASNLDKKTIWKLARFNTFEICWQLYWNYVVPLNFL